MEPGRKLLYRYCFVGLLLFLAGCAVPQRLWPQRDIAASETPGQDAGQVVLIASRSSKFKRALVSELQKQLAALGIGQKTIGVEELQRVDAAGYAAVVVINTCLAWGLDHDVKTFLDGQKTHANIILLTTSGDGAWLPEKRGRDFDAVSAASKMTTVDAVARDLRVRIQTRLHRAESARKH